MTNAEKFRKIFKEFATEVWAFPEKDFLTWLNAEYKEPTTKNNLGVDCVSRDSAIKALDYDIKCFKFKFGVHKYMDDITKLLNTIYETQVNNIKALPSVTPQEPRWIPVEEKLPEDGQSVLFCDIDNDIMVGYHVKGRPNTHFSQDGTYEDIKNVRAWMPLPKPYREVEE